MPVRFFYRHIAALKDALRQGPRYLVLACALLAGSAWAQPTPAVALYYGSGIALSEFGNFDILVVDPDHATAPRLPTTQVYAYASVTEVHPTRAYYDQIPAQWKLARNADWQSDVIDQSIAQWPDFFADKVIAPLWQQGYRGFFLDTLDSYRLAQHFDEQAQQQGLVRVINTLHQRFPGIQLIFNRGFELIPQLPGKVQMVAAESLYRAWNARTGRYEEVPQDDRAWLLGQLRTIQERDHLPVLVIDYAPPQERELARRTAEKIAADGFIPWVTDSDLSSVGIGSIEPVARRVLVLYNADASPSLRYSNAHRYLQMPLNHLGYVVDYADVNQPLPSAIYPDRYAGVITWFSGFYPGSRGRMVEQWLGQRMDLGLPLAIVGTWGKEPGAAFARKLGLQNAAEPAAPTALTLLNQHPMLGLEAQPPLPGAQSDLEQLSPALLAQSTPLLALRDAQGRTLVGGAITPWGGFILNPNVLTEIPGTEAARWIVDPFAFLQASLRLPTLPIPDTTTENGRRLLTVHVDGDAYNTRAEFPGSPLTAQVLLDQVFRKYRIPQTMSIVEYEAHEMTPELTPRLEAIAREIFQLPHMEVGSHTYSHPFLWDTSRRHGLYLEDSEAALTLDVPGYTMDLEREIVGSTAYINTRLAPPDKPVKLLQWSGDTAPGEAALAITARAGLLNLNGGDTFISKLDPSLTAIGALGLRKGPYLQVYAPATNENIYTNLWTGPFYGFERVIETFEMTGSPRRIKPVGIYYHSYSASKPASLKAVHKAYDWALRQPLHPIHAYEFAQKVQDFYDFAIARDGTGWRLSSPGRLRTVRLPAALGVPDVQASQAIAGWRPGEEAPYVHMTGASARLQTAAAAGGAPYLYEANGRLAAWQRTDKGFTATFQGHVPLVVTLANTQGCQVRADRRPIAAQRRSANTQTFQLTHAAAQIDVLCPGH